MAHWIKKTEHIEKYKLGWSYGVKCGDYVVADGKMRCQGKGTRWISAEVIRIEELGEDINTPPRVECMTCDSAVVLWHLMDADRRTG